MNLNAGLDIAGLCSSLSAGGYSVMFYGFSAIDKYLGLPDLPALWIETNADIAALAKLIENLRFPGVEIADGAVDIRGRTCYFRCQDKFEENSFSFPMLSLRYDWHRQRFFDPLEIYPTLRNLRKRRGNYPNAADNNPADNNLAEINPKAGHCRIIMDAALLFARYNFEVKKPDAFAESAFDPANYRQESAPPPEMQRAFLNCLLVSPWPERGLEFLKRSGLLDEIWPELSGFDGVNHSKEFHPEGNVWNHTLETFRYRKPAASGAFDLKLSLGLLLHDIGKPISASFGNRRFDGHAELGARAAARFLRRLEYENYLVDEIFFLVRNHMLPAALKRLPLSKTEEIMNSPMFPTLMELYRCDESSSFKGLDGFYENSSAYQAYLKNLKNPYRSADGKKIGRKRVYGTTAF
jgi:poly(A) polymerase